MSTSSTKNPVSNQATRRKSTNARITALLVADEEQNRICCALEKNGFNVIRATSENLVDGDMPAAIPHVAIIKYNWQNNIGLRAYLLNRNNLYAIPVVFFGQNCTPTSGRDLLTIGRFTELNTKQMVAQLRRYFYSSGKRKPLD